MEARRIIGLCLIAGILYVVYDQESKKSVRSKDLSAAAIAAMPEIPYAEPYTSGVAAVAKVKATEAAQPKERETSRWEYQSNTDEMRGTTNRWASLLSDTTADVGAYRAESARLRLDIRNMPKQYGLDVILSIPKGQITCSYDGCKIPMRFDGGPIITYTADRGESRHDTIFIREKSGFIKRAKNASKIIVEVPIWRKGNQQFIFSPSGLEWESK